VKIIKRLRTAMSCRRLTEIRIIFHDESFCYVFHDQSYKHASVTRRVSVNIQQQNTQKIEHFRERNKKRQKFIVSWEFRSEGQCIINSIIFPM